MMTSVGYPQLDRQMADLAVGLAEAHGLLCGLLCGRAEGATHSSTQASIEAWLAEVLAHGDEAGESARPALLALAERTCEALADASSALDPVLPPEDSPLRERAEAVYDWSRGFLYGLGLARVDLGSLSSQARECCDDFLAITHLDLDDLAATDANEAALTELTEFIRVAAMLVYADRAGGAS